MFFHAKKDENFGKFWGTIWICFSRMHLCWCDQCLTSKLWMMMSIMNYYYEDSFNLFHLLLQNPEHAMKNSIYIYWHQFLRWYIFSPSLLSFADNSKNGWQQFKRVPFEMKVIRLPKYNSVFRVRVLNVIVVFSCAHWIRMPIAIDIWNKVKPVIVPTMRWMWTHQIIRNKIRNKSEMKISLMWRSTPYKSCYSLSIILLFAVYNCNCSICEYLFGIVCQQTHINWGI